jgi:hypothetical protein
MTYVNKIKKEDARIYRKNLADMDMKFLNLCIAREALGPEITATMFTAHEEAIARAIFAFKEGQSLEDFKDTFKKMLPTDEDLERHYRFLSEVRYAAKGSNALMQ